MPNLFLNHDERFQRKIKNFPDTLYRVNDPTSKIYRLLYSLLEIGIGQAKGMQDLALISQNSLSNTTGQELDQYFQMFGIKRTPDFARGTQSPVVNDSKFRVAISKFLQAISLGGTSEGLRLMSEASSGFKCHVIEPWRNPANAEGLARLKNESNEPVGNEVIIFIYPNRPLDESGDEENRLRIRVIENCKIIAPLHTSITVKIQVVEEPLEFVPSYVTSEAFSYIEEPTEPELLSQEAEISFNSSVTSINTFEIDDEFTIPLGFISQTSIDVNDTSLKIEERETPLTINFYLKLVEDNKEEIVLVQNRQFFASPNIFTYDVLRAQNNTTALTFNEGTVALSNLVTLYSDNQDAQIVFDSWQTIPLADSPDNFSMGKFPNDARKYDSSGNYLFEWSSQSEFRYWFQNHINNLGGEIQDNQYRLAMNNNLTSSSIVNFNIINQIMGPAYKYARPVPKPMSN